MKKLKDEFRPGGARRQHILDKAVDYLANGPGLQNDKMHFCLNNLEMSMPEYLTALDKAVSAAGPDGEGWYPQACGPLVLDAMRGSVRNNGG